MKITEQAVKAAVKSTILGLRYGSTPEAIAESALTAPAATVTGLETVETQYTADGYTWIASDEFFVTFGFKPSDVLAARELVTRQNAEEVIKNLELQILDATFSDKLDGSGAPLSWQQRAEEAEADNAALTARVKELEEHFAEMTRSCLAERDRNKVLEADNKRLREALEDISRGETTTYDEDVGTEVSTWLDEEEMQSIARAALGEVKL